VEELCVRPAFCPELQLEIVVEKNIWLSKLSSDSTLYHKVAERPDILSFFFYTFVDVAWIVRSYGNFAVLLRLVIVFRLAGKQKMKIQLTLILCKRFLVLNKIFY
jgi:hypothetical protein